MSRGQGEFDARELVFREGFVGIDTPLEEELAGALDGVPYKIYVGVVRLFRGRPAWTSMRKLAEQLHQRHAQVVTTLAQLEALHLIAYETTRQGTWVEVLPCSPQALVALRERAVERLGEDARFSRRAEQRQVRARAELGLPQPAPQPPRPKRRRPSGGRAAGPAAGASPARRLPANEAPARGGDGEATGGLPPSGSPGWLAEASPRAAGGQAPHPAAGPPGAAVPWLAAEPPPAPPLPSPESLAGWRPAEELQASSAQPSHPAAQPVAALQEPAAPPAGPEPTPGEPPAASQLALEATADPETPAAVLTEACGRLAPPAEGLPGTASPASPPPQPASDQPAEARTEGGSEATDEDQGDQPASGEAVVASQEPIETAAPGGEPGAEAPSGGEPASGGLGARPALLLGGALDGPLSGALDGPPGGGAPNCSLDPFLKIPPSLPSPAPARGASQPEGGREESLGAPAAEPTSQPTPAASPGAQPPAPEPPASASPALVALGALVTLACSLWPHKLHPSAAERWLRQAIALVEPAPSRAEMAAFLRWAAEEESLTKAAVPLAAAVSPGRLVPWMTKHRAELQRRQLLAARACEGANARQAVESRVEQDAPDVRELLRQGKVGMAAVDAIQAEARRMGRSVPRCRVP